MTAPKKNSAATAKTASPQAFDIIPRSRVLPSANARPIIPSNQTPQADNTLTAQPGDTPALSTHAKIHLKPLDDEAHKTVVPSGALTAEELKAKLSARSTASNKQEAVTDKQPADGEELETMDDLPELDETVEPTEADDEPKLEKVTADEPETDEGAIEQTKPDATDDSDDPAEPQPGSLEHALKDEPETSIEHSQALKDELQGMADDDAGDAEKTDQADKSGLDEHGRRHHELYGGKPVIVVHKHRRSTRMMLWVVWLFFCLLLAVAAVDVLLDADIITTDYNVPHTDFL